MPTPADLMHPRGPIQPSMFNGSENANEALAVWIAEAEAAGHTGDALTAYVEAQAYEATATRLAADPMSSSYDGHSTSHDPRQIEYFKEAAKSARARLASLQAAGQRTTGTSGAARNVFTF